MKSLYFFNHLVAIDSHHLFLLSTDYFYIHMPHSAVLTASQQIAIFRPLIMDVCMIPQLASRLLTQIGAWFLHFLYCETNIDF